MKPYKLKCSYCGRLIHPEDERGDEEHYGLLRFYHVKCKQEHEPLRSAKHDAPQSVDPHV